MLSSSQASSSSDSSGSNIQLDFGLPTSPTTSSTATHDESDADENALEPPRKRSRTGLKPRRKKGYLAQIVHVPMDIFAQIMSFLQPIDIHSLARTNQKFRTLLMSRSAKHIWRAAERNVPDLPTCPAHLTEPEYAALVFGKWCSMCGTTANLSRRMDPMLSVRLCSTCRDKSVVSITFIPQNVLPFARLSHGIKSPSANHPAYGLMDEVDWIVSIAFELASRGDAAEWEKWKEERELQMQKQAAFAKDLVVFWKALDARRYEEIEELKAKRFAEIKARLLADGWEEIDCYVTHYRVVREWEKLVFQPKPLTNRTWDNIKPSLEYILKANKEARLEQERQQRKKDRKARLCQLVADISTAEPQFIHLTREHEQPFGPPEALVMPFPTDKRALNLHSVKRILKLDITGDAAGEQFVAARASVEGDLRGWRQSLADQLSEKLEVRSGYEQILGRCPRRYGRNRTPEPPVALSTKFSTESQAYIVGSSIRKLLRADSVFQLDDDSACRFFPDVIQIVQDDLTTKYSGHWYSDSDDSEPEFIFEGELPKALDLSRVHPHSGGRAAAKSLLACLGKPDAAYLEMKVMGKRFVCGRCWVKEPMTWAEMLEHYSQSMVYSWPFSTVFSLQRQGIECREEHILYKKKGQMDTLGLAETGSPSSNGENDMPVDSEPKPLPPLVTLLTLEEAAAIENEPPSPKFACTVCDTVANMHDNQGVNRQPIPRPKGKKEVMLEHLGNVHNIPEDKRESMLVACM